MFMLSCVSQPLPVKSPPAYAWPRTALCYGANRSRITPGVSPWNSAAGVFCELQIRPRSDAYVMGSPRLMQRQLSSNFFCRAPKWEGYTIAQLTEHHILTDVSL